MAGCGSAAFSNILAFLLSLPASSLVDKRERKREDWREESEIKHKNDVKMGRKGVRSVC